MDNLLSIVTFIPLIAAVILALFLRGEDEAAQLAAKRVALATTVATFLISIVIYVQFDPSNPGFQMVEEHKWIGGFNYKLGVDGISILFVLLTTFLMPLVIGASWNVNTRVKEYMIAFLVLETLMIAVFSALDLVLFYVVFEAGLIPMFLIIGIWGGKERIYASFKFFLYTLLGSVLMLVAIIAMYLEAGTTDIPTLLTHSFPSTTITILGWHITGGMQTLLFLAFLASFAVKLPMWPVHTWLPDAHTEAPTAGSVILAGILLKMGAYGFLRFSLPMLPDASQYFVPFMVALSLVAIIYISLVAMMQTDMKRLIAYSSIAHMGFVTLGTFMFTQIALEGAVVGMISHGFVAAALFLCVGVMYDRLHTREIGDYGGVVNVMPVFAAVMLFFCMANVALPGASAFIGEIMVLIGTFSANPVYLGVSTKWVAIAAATSVILSACYTLWMYKRVVMGDLVKDSVKTMQDMSLREFGFFVPLILLTLWIGFYPLPVLDWLHASVSHLVAQATGSKLAAAAALAQATPVLDAVHH